MSFNAHLFLNVIILPAKKQYAIFDYIFENVCSSCKCYQDVRIFVDASTVPMC